MFFLWQFLLRTWQLHVVPPSRGRVLSSHYVWGQGKSSFHCFYFFAMRFSAFLELGKKPHIFWNLRTPLLVKCANHGCTFVYFFESRFSEFSVLTVHDGWSVWLISRWCVHQPLLRLLVLCPLFQTSSARVASMSLLLMASLVVTVRRQPWRANGSNFIESCHYSRILIDSLHSCFISERPYYTHKEYLGILYTCVCQCSIKMRFLQCYRPSRGFLHLASVLIESSKIKVVFPPFKTRNNLQHVDETLRSEDVLMHVCVLFILDLISLHGYEEIDNSARSHSHDMFAVTVVVVLVLVAFCVIIVYGCVRYFWIQRRKKFDFFICHHKAGPLLAAYWGVGFHLQKRYEQSHLVYIGPILEVVLGDCLIVWCYW